MLIKRMTIDKYMDEQINQQIGLANIYFRSQHYDEAIKLYDSLINQNNQNYILYCNRSAALFKLGKFNESLEDAICAIKLNAKSTKARYREGMALRSLDKPIDAIIAYSKGLVIDKKNFQLLDCLLNTLKTTGFWSSIEPSLNQLKSINSTLSPFLVISLIGQHILTLEYYLESSILLNCSLKIDTESLKLKSSIYASLAVAHWKLATNNKNKLENTNLALDAMKNDLECVIKLNDLNGQYRALTNIANAYQQMKNYKNAIHTFEEILKLANQEENLNLILKSLKVLSNLFNQLNDLRKAIYYQEKVCKLVEKFPQFDKLKPKSYLLLSDLYEQVGSYQKSNEFCRKLFYLNVNDNYLKLLACERLGKNEMKLSNLLEAKNWFENELKLSEKMENCEIKLDCLKNLANVNLKLKNYQLSIDLNEQMFEQLNNLNDQLSNEKKLEILKNLGEIHLVLNDYSKSIYYFREHLKLDNNYQSNNRLEIMKKLSICYKKKNQLDDTLKLYFDILNYAKDQNDLDGQLWSFYNIGFLYSTNGSFNQAIPIFQEYLELFNENQVDHNDEYLNVNHTLGLIYFQMDDFKNSFNFFCKDVNLVEKLKEYINDFNINLECSSEMISNNQFDQLDNVNDLITCIKIFCILLGSKTQSDENIHDIIRPFDKLNLF